MYRGTLALVCGAIAIAPWSTTLDRVSSSLHNWIIFPAWKVLSGKANNAESVKLDDVYIYSEKYGGGPPPVLVLHGGLGSIGSKASQDANRAKARERAADLAPIIAELRPAPRRCGQSPPA
jgi:hypothetical protein